MSGVEKTCGNCGRWIEIPLQDGGECEGSERIGVCECAWRLDIAESIPLFEGIDPDEEHPDCGYWISAQDGRAWQAVRECHDAGTSSNFFRCSNCGCEIMRCVDGWKPLYMGDVNYCPNCGAKVVW